MIFKHIIEKPQIIKDKLISKKIKINNLIKNSIH